MWILNQNLVGSHRKAMLAGREPMHVLMFDKMVENRSLPKNDSRRWTDSGQWRCPCKGFL